MKPAEYVVDGVLNGGNPKMLIEELSQLKADKARGAAKRAGVDLDIVVALAEIDPTANGGYLDWLVRCYKNRQLDPGFTPEGEGAQDIRVTIERYEKMKRLPQFKGDKNVMAYKTFTDLRTAIMDAGNITSRAEKGKQLRPFLKIVHDRWPLLDKKGQPVMVGGYPEWITKLVNSGEVVLPEDGDKVLSAIEEFEKCRQDPEFRMSKNILNYPTLSELVAAVDAGREVTLSFDRLPDEPGLEFIDGTSVFGHYYDLYKVTKFSAASHLWAKANFAPGHNGWCVVNKGNWEAYKLGPKNPAWFFRRDGLNYALCDLGIGSGRGDFRDGRDQNGSVALLYELLYLNMPPQLKDFLLSKNEWTRKYKAEILAGGPNAAIAKAFENASIAATENPKDAWEAAKDAITFLRQSEFAYPPPEAMEFLHGNPILATIYAQNVEKARLPVLEQSILNHPHSAGMYWQHFNNSDATPGGKWFPGRVWPELEARLKEWVTNPKTRGNAILPLYMYATSVGRPLPEELAKYISEKDSKGNHKDVYRRYLQSLETKGEWVHNPELNPVLKNRAPKA